MNFRIPLKCKPMNKKKANIALQSIYQLLDSKGFCPKLCYGTLLGAVRDKDFIKNDGDIDLVLDKKFWLDVRCLSQTFMERGFEVKCAENDVVKLDYYGVSIDLYFVGERNIVDKLLSRQTWNHKWRTCFIDNFYLEGESFVTIKNKQYRTLFSPESWLMQTYGADYLVPQNKKGNTWTLTTKIYYFLFIYRKWRVGEFKKKLKEWLK